MLSPGELRNGGPKDEASACVLRRLGTLGCMIAAILLSACSRHTDPQAALNHAILTLHTGYFTRAGAEADKGYKEFHATSTDWAWKFTIVRGRVLYSRGMYGDVLKLLASEPLPPCCGDLAVQRYRLEAAAHRALQQFQQAEQILSEAQAICSASQYPTCADLNVSEGELEVGRGHYTQAQDLLQKALASTRARGDRFMEASALLDLSWAADEQAHSDEALDWASAALDICARETFLDGAQTALGDLGWAYYKLGDREKARQMFTEAERQAAKLDDEGDQIAWLTAAGDTYMDDGDLREAERLFHQSLDLALRINSREDIMDSRTALAFVSEQAGNIDDAKRSADEALAMARAGGNGLDIIYALLVEGRISARRNDTAAAETAFHQVEQSADAPVFLKWEAERSLARLYEDENQPDSADREYRTALSTFEAARCGLHQRVDDRLPFLSNAARIYEDYIHSLASRGKTNEALQVADYARARTLAEGLGRPCKATFAPDPLNAPEIARRAGGTILFYALGQEHSYLWAITPHQVRLFPLTANQTEIDAAVERYRKKIEGPREILEASTDGSVLYQMLIAPAEDFLKKDLAKNGNVFIIPDSGLNSLNFETLVPETHVPETPITETPRPQISSPQPKRYWIEDVTIANAASLHLLRASHGNRAKLAGTLLLMGNPVAADAGRENAYPELPNADSQMKNIEKYFPSERQEVFARQQASPAAYLNSHLEQFSYIHFVAHGTASRLNPLDSAIILSREPGSNPAASQGDSFKLYARDIINGHPLHAELVTISACYSTGNRTYSGEGLVGLSWAFLRAGAHNVIGALWDVSDASTSQLVDEFYSELNKGKSPAAALRTAKLSLLHDSPFRNPFYWAPFQLYTGS
jgi:CHAT domain-containing protein